MQLEEGVLVFRVEPSQNLLYSKKRKNRKKKPTVKHNKLIPQNDALHTQPKHPA